MGLDMYLRGEKFQWTNWEDEKTDLHQDGFRVTTIILELGYWRKHPDLHGYIVQTFAGGKDECQRIELDENDIVKIILAIEEDKLPHTEGFFFGSSKGPFAYDKQKVIETFKNALAWVSEKPDTEKNWSREVYYQASW